MATVFVVYTWPGGGTLTAGVRAKINNPEALAVMRIETKRLFDEALGALVAVDHVAADEAPEPTN